MDSESLCHAIKSINSTLSFEQHFILQLGPGTHVMCPVDVGLDVSAGAVASALPSIQFVGDRNKTTTILLPVNMTMAESIETYWTVTYSSFDNITYQHLRFDQDTPYPMNTVSTLNYDSASVGFFNCSFTCTHYLQCHIHLRLF
jgi:hypothetical protein